MLPLILNRINETYKVFVKGGTEETNLEGLWWCIKAEELGAGEILLTSMDKDGTKSGFDIPFLSMLTKNVNIPVIASGGAGSMEHFLECFNKAECGCLSGRITFSFR